MQAMRSPLGMLFCHHDDTEQLSNLEKCHGNILAMTLFISMGSGGRGLREGLITPSCAQGKDRAVHRGWRFMPCLQVSVPTILTPHHARLFPRNLIGSDLWQDKIPGFRILGIFQNLSEFLTPWREKMSLLLPQNLHGRAAN